MSKDSYQTENSVGDACDQDTDYFSLLPEEIQLELFSYLDFYDSPNDLANCRLVCKSWKAHFDSYGVELWNPNIPQPNSGALIKFRNMKGTQFLKAEDVDAFFSKWKNQDENPFVNSTLVINCNVVEDFRQLSKRVPELIAKFGRYVRRCLLFVHAAVPESIENIKELYKLSNVRSITLYCPDVFFSKYIWNEPPVYPNMKQLTSLCIFGEDGHRVLETCFANYALQIKHLEISRDSGCTSHNILYFLKNLKELKVLDFSPDTYDLGLWKEVKLKRLSLKFVDSKIMYPILQAQLHIMLSKFSETLEDFFLENEPKHYSSYVPSSPELPFYHQGLRLHYRPMEMMRLTTFGISYGFIETPDFLQNIVGSFTRLEKFYFLDNKDEISKLEDSSEDWFQKKLVAVWQVLPSTVSSICVCSKKWNEEKRICFSVLFQFKRSASLIGIEGGC